jgi:hypothetical protein
LSNSKTKPAKRKREYQREHLYLANLLVAWPVAKVAPERVVCLGADPVTECFTKKLLLRLRPFSLPSPQLLLLTMLVVWLLQLLLLALLLL